jgi:hypothetical protein
VTIDFRTVFGAIIILGGALALFLAAVPLRSRAAKLGRGLRSITGLTQLRRAIGLAVEDGKRLHVSIGQAGPLSPSSAASLVGLSTLERIAALSIISDRPPVATSGEGSLAILSQDTLRFAYRAGNSNDLYDPERGRLTGVTPFSYIAGTLPVIRDEQVSTNILTGSFGPEVVLLTDAAEQQRSFVLAASDSLPAQAALYAAAQEPLIGEELFAVPAYLQAGPFHQASLQVQDVLRWGLIFTILVGAILKLFNIL